MPTLYSNRSSYPKSNAQQNLCGRTHFVDDDTLRFHKSRVISSREFANGLLFGVVTSDALDYQNSKRGFRFSIFDVFGTVLDRTPMESAFRTSTQASVAMWKAVGVIDAVGVTLSAIKRAEHYHAQEMAELRAKLQPVEQAA